MLRLVGFTWLVITFTHFAFAATPNSVHIRDLSIEEPGRLKPGIAYDFEMNASTRQLAFGTGHPRFVIFTIGGALGRENYVNRRVVEVMTIDEPKNPQDYRDFGLISKKSVLK